MGKPKRKTATMSLLIVSLFSSIGVAIILLGILLYRNAQAFVDHSQEARGRIVATDATTTGKQAVRFQTESGETVTVPMRWALGGPKPGQSVTVFYDPQNPQDAKMDTVSDLWLGVVAAFGIGAAFTLLPLLFSVSVLMKPGGKPRAKS